VVLPPTLPGIGPYVAWILIVVVTLSAVAAYWIAPVGAPLLPRERMAQRVPPWLLIGSWSASVGALILGLALTIDPIGCARHATLVSAYVPSGAGDWHIREDEVRAATADEARQLHQEVVDLAPVRDAVLIDLKDLGTVDPDRLTEAVPALVAERLRAFVRLGAVGKPQYQQRRESELDPVIIETVELAVLMGWRALYPGSRQNLTYLVSDRAEEYGWDWNLVARLNFSDEREAPALRVARVRSTSKRPQLDRVAASRVASDGTAASVDALFTGNEGGSVTVELEDAAGNTVSQPRTVLIAAGKTVTLVRIDFVLTSPSRPAKLLQLPSNASGLQVEGAIVRALPPSTPDPLRLSLSAAAALQTQLVETIAFVTSRTAVCRNAGTALDAFHPAQVIQHVGRIEIAAAVRESDVTLVVRPDGALWLVPSTVLHRAQIGDWQPLDFLGGRTLADPKLVTERMVEGTVLVLWRREAEGPRFDLHRLGFPLGGALKPRVLATDVLPDPVRGDIVLLSATGEGPEKVFSQRLTLDAYAHPIAPVAARFAVDRSDSPDLRYSATAFALDVGALGVLCGAPVPEPDAFYGFWQFVIDEAVRAATPQLAVASNWLHPSVGAPRIAMERPLLRRLATSRAELPFVAAFGSLGVYILLVIFGLSRLKKLRLDQ
jgi:hypothetical protein